MRGDKENVQRQLYIQAPSAAVIRKLKSTALQQSIFIISCTAGVFIYLKVIFLSFHEQGGRDQRTRLLSERKEEAKAFIFVYRNSLQNVFSGILSSPTLSLL
jgi:hypothetical protein